MVAHGHERGPLIAWRIRRHDHNADALVLRDIWVGSTRKPDEVGLVGPGGVDLRAVDDKLIAINNCRCAQAGKVGARFWLGVADGEVELACEDARQVSRLLFIGAVGHDGGADRVDRDKRKGRVGPLDLVEHDELVDGASTLTAVFGRPCQPQPAI